MTDSYRQWERDQLRLQDEIEKEQRAEQRARDSAEKEQWQQYVEKRKASAKEKTAQLAQTVEELESILRNGLQQPGRFDVTSLYREPQVPKLKLGTLASPIPEPEFVTPDPPGLLSRFLGGGRRYDQYFQLAREDYENELAAARRAERTRQREVAAKRQEHEVTVQRIREECQQHNEALAALENGVVARDKASVERYLEYMLHAVPLPSKFPRHAEAIFNSTTEQAVVRFELPPRDVVPTVRAYRYVQKPADEERATNRPAKEVAALYRSVVSQVALLCLRNLFQSDDKLDMIGFNGHVHAVNPATGVTPTTPTLFYRVGARHAVIHV